MNRSPLLSLILLPFLCQPLLAEEEKPEPFTEDFSSYEVGEEPDLFILDGTFTVDMEEGDNKVLRLDPNPLTEASIQFGDSLKGSGEVTARIKGIQRRRSFPRFGVGLHGFNGYRLRVVPTRKELELVKGEEVIQTAPFEWSSEQWHFVKLRAQKLADDRWSISGWAWAESSKAPDRPLIEYIGEEQRLIGKGSIMGTPYSAEPIFFDDVVIEELED